MHFGWAVKASVFESIVHEPRAPVRIAHERARSDSGDPGQLDAPEHARKWRTGGL